MQTRCPQCGTWFEVTEAHLSLADGQVHCGRCDTRFDAREHLFGKPSMPATAEPGPQEPPHAASTLVEETVSAAAGPDGTAAAILPSLPDVASPAPRREIAWTVGAVLLALAIGLQTLWWWRDDWTATPSGLYLVEVLCRVAPCRAHPPREPERIDVLARSLSLHPQRPGALQFRLRLVNRAARPQPYPHLELRLYDHQQQLTAARRFEPADYLPAAADRGGVLEPDRPLSLDLELEDPGNHVTGFEIDFL